MKSKNYKAFTLVELVVVITILAILWTIAFLSFQWYSTNARDSTRKTDTSSMKSSLELYVLKIWTYPIPTNGVPITYSWWWVWTQWTIWDSVIWNLSNINKKPVDPLFGTEYTYSITANKNEYQIAWIYEWGLSYNKTLLSDTYASTQMISYIDWNYNWVMLKAWNNILWIPSIILTDIQNPSSIELKTMWWYNLVLNWTYNTPSSFKSLVNIDLNNESKFLLYSLEELKNGSWSSLVVWSWSSLPQTVSELSLLWNNLLKAYSGTTLQANNNQNLKNIISSNGDLLKQNLWWILNVSYWTKIDLSQFDVSSSWPCIFWSGSGWTTFWSCSL